MGRRSWWQRSLDTHFRSLEVRIKRQKERIPKQREQAIERASEARRQGEAVVGMDVREEKRIAKELRWRGSWNRRRAKWDTRARKYA